MPASRLPALKSFALMFKPVLAWIPIFTVILLTLLCFVAKAVVILRIAYPVACFMTAVWLYFRYPILYLGFNWWVWFLTPFVRRVGDLQGGWLDPNPIMLTPFLTALITLVTFVQYFPKAYHRGGLPFLMAIVAVIYGLLVGISNWSLIQPLVPLLNWLTPILFGFHLFVHWRQYPLYRRVTQRVFLWGVAVMGFYGIVQYLFAPAWDRFWLMNQETQVFGIPEPLGIRVFSTMNSTQPFACVMAAGLVLLFSDRGGARFLAAGVGYLSFLLTLARSSWLGWVVSLAFFIPSLKQRLQIRLVLTVFVMTILVLPLTAIDPFADVINSRLQSLFDIGNDVSFNARSVGYNQALGLALNEVVGQGLGGVIISESLGPNDSGILSLLFLLGWFGTLPYLGGLLVLLLSLTRKIEGGDDPFAAASRAIALGTFAQIGLNESMLGVFGMVLWGFLGIALAAQRYYWYQRQTQSDSIEELHETLSVANY
ncbi:MAG: O-antigen ligase domain-containing protein [Oscillatoriales cyanobacterium C42_A2020_001]|nr:O-antigen ligase domain-containing protein [Leptolyngbyaceae cyanobacterium C42_A2020_001]